MGEENSGTLKEQLVELEWVILDYEKKLHLDKYNEIYSKVKEMIK